MKNMDSKNKFHYTPHDYILILENLDITFNYDVD